MLKVPKMNIFMHYLSVFVIFMISGITLANGEIGRPRGVAISKAVFYQAGDEFSCLDGTSVLPYSRINDDYCDCPDGTDEPGTSACPNGSFHCTNAGHKPKYIPSSWVNDGICDCCDGTDEFTGLASCKNDCREMGKSAREEADRQRLISQEGHKIYQQYTKEAQEAKAAKQARLLELDGQKSAAEAKKNDLLALKEEAEIPEKDAKEKHESAWNEIKEQRQAERENQKIEDAFTDLDKNADGEVSVDEIQQHSEFDIDSSGDVSYEEAKEYLEDNESINFETFQSNVWPNIKDLYQKPVAPEQEDVSQAQPIPPNPTDTEAPPFEPQEAPPFEPQEDVQEEQTEEPQEPEGDYDNDDDRDDDHDDDEDDHDDDNEDEDNYDRDRDYHGDDYDEDYIPAKEDKGDTNEEDKMPPYDEETQQYIDAANDARRDYDDADKAFKDTEQEISDITRDLGIDYGPNSAWYTLKDQCIEFTDREYTYKLCLFDKSTQRNKNGGSETSLGTWGKWSGPEDDLFSEMKYDNGQGCWNGPNRSTRVLIGCGSFTQLVSAAEPNRCEYEFQIYTPAACSSPPAVAPKDGDHDEL